MKHLFKMNSTKPVILARAGTHFSSKSGLSLMELILSVALLSILSTFIVTHMISAWNASEKNITNIHCAITANNIYEHLLASSTPVDAFLNNIETVASKAIASNTIYHAAGEGDLFVLKAGSGAVGRTNLTGSATYSIIVAAPYFNTNAFRASFKLNFFVHNPPHP